MDVECLATPNPRFKILGPETIQFTQDSSYEMFLGQFQSICPKILCLVNGTKLRYYDKNSDNNSLPTNISFCNKKVINDIDHYYFVNNDNADSYCIFGREAALIWFPQIEQIENQVNQYWTPKPVTIKNNIITNNSPINKINKIPNNITIIDKGETLVFPNYNYPVIIKTHYPV